MMTSPRIGQQVSVRYNQRICGLMPLHGRTGIVRVRSNGKPRNHGIEIDGIIHVIPCGNLFKIEENP